MIAAIKTAAVQPPVPLYQQGQRCPSCSQTLWWIGRRTAECANCGHAAPLGHPGEACQPLANEVPHGR